MSNIARNIASSGASQNPWPGMASRSLAARKDSGSPRLLSSPSARISASQLLTIASDLTDHDQAVLLFLAQVRLATGRQIARRLWGSKAPTDRSAWAARRTLWRLEEWRIVSRLPRRVGGVRGGSASLVYAVGSAGRRLLAQRGSEIRRLGTPGDRHIKHTLATTELVVRLHEADLRGELELLQLETEPVCWRVFLEGFFSARMVLKPDAFMRIGAGAFEDRYFVEMDLATEHPATLLSKAKRYVAYYRAGEEQRLHDVFPRVVWIVPEAARADEIRTVLQQLPEAGQRLFVTWPADEVIGRLSAEAST